MFIAGAMLTKPAHAFSALQALLMAASAGSFSNLVDSDFILDERARELHWEGTRRTDLIRYNRFTESTYLWPWKGGVAAGQSVDAKFKLFPIPASDLTANPNIKQNPGY